MLNFIEDAHLKSMSTFDADEHLQGSAFCLVCHRWSNGANEHWTEPVSLR